ncbi:MAG TPA: NAD-dependent epimerase/dehydratase family protein [Anaerolineae bacterium]|nr:NAD-dependent epimerase/dehydratase family protein [Anaerolineae bacterium]
MRVLVTGGAGFIGSHIIERLIALGYSVTALDNLSSGRTENIHPSADFIQADITEPHLPRALLARKFDVIVHQAAQVSVLRSVDDPLFDAQVNLVGTARLLEYARHSGVKRFVFASSAAVYGNLNLPPIAEDAPTNPLSPYAMSKLAAEQHLRQFSQTDEIQIVILRYANVYGPRQSAHGEAGVICAFMHQMLDGEPLLIHGDGRQTRDFVYVDDVVAANVLALKPDAPPGVYNVGTGRPTSILELHQTLIGPELSPRYAPSRPGDVLHSTLDNTAIQSALGWAPIVSLAEGLARTWRYFFRSNGSTSAATPVLTAPLKAASPGRL